MSAQRLVPSFETAANAWSDVCVAMAWARGAAIGVLRCPDRLSRCRRREAEPIEIRQL